MKCEQGPLLLLPQLDQIFLSGRGALTPKRALLQQPQAIGANRAVEALLKQRQRWLTQQQRIEHLKAHRKAELELHQCAQALRRGRCVQVLADQVER